MRGDALRGGACYQPFLPRAREGLLDEAVHVERPLRLEDVSDVRASLPPRDRLRDPDHQALREDEVQPPVARPCDLREGGAHGDDEELREAKPFRELAR